MARLESLVGKPVSVLDRGASMRNDESQRVPHRIPVDCQRYCFVECDLAERPFACIRVTTEMHKQHPWRAGERVALAEIVRVAIAARNIVCVGSAARTLGARPRDVILALHAVCDE
jgi:hypothetical protein